MLGSQNNAIKHIKCKIKQSGLTFLNIYGNNPIYALRYKIYAGKCVKNGARYLPKFFS